MVLLVSLWCVLQESHYTRFGKPKGEAYGVKKARVRNGGHTCNPNTAEVEAWAHDQPRLYNEFEVKDGYMKLCFKNPKDGGSVKEPKKTSQGGWWLENRDLQDGMTMAVRTSQAKAGYQIHCWE